MGNIEPETIEAAAPQRVPHIEKVINETIEHIDKLSEIIADLGSRLSSVLRDEGPEKDSEGKKSQKLVPLADQIQKINEAIYHQYNRLQSIIARLEL